MQRAIAWLATILAALLSLALLWFVLVAPNLHCAAASWSGPCRPQSAPHPAAGQGLIAGRLRAASMGIP